MFTVKSRVRDVSGVSEMGSFSTKQSAERFMMQQVEIMKGYNLSHWADDTCGNKSPIFHRMVDRNQMSQSTYWIERTK